MYSIRELAEDIKSLTGATVVTNCPTGSAANTFLEIQGSGYLVGINNVSTTSRTFTIQIDGGSVYRIDLLSLGLNLFPLRFHSSLVVKCSTTVANGIFAWAVLD